MGQLGWCGTLSMDVLSLVCGEQSLHILTAAGLPGDIKFHFPFLLQDVIYGRTLTPYPPSGPLFILGGIPCQVVRPVRSWIRYLRNQMHSRRIHHQGLPEHRDVPLENIDYGRSLAHHFRDTSYPPAMMSIALIHILIERR